MIANHEVTLTQQYAGVALVSVPLFLLAGASAAVFWVLGASFFTIAGEGASTLLHFDYKGFPGQDPGTGQFGKTDWLTSHDRSSIYHNLFEEQEATHVG